MPTESLQMHRSLVTAAALLAGIGIAAPMLAWSADTPPQMPPAAAMPQGMAGMPGMGGMMPGMQGPEQRVDRPGGMHEMMMHPMMQLSPQQRCEERLARRAGRVAYTV